MGWYIHFVLLLLWSRNILFVFQNREKKNELLEDRKLLQLKERIGNRRQNKMLIFYFILIFGTELGQARKNRRKEAKHKKNWCTWYGQCKLGPPTTYNCY